jgi:hypothetical protein
MQSRNKFLDDMSQLMTNAMGVAQGAKTEAETAMKGPPRRARKMRRLRHGLPHLRRRWQRSPRARAGGKAAARDREAGRRTLAQDRFDPGGVA